MTKLGKAIFAVLLLAGCSANSLDDLRQSAPKVYEQSGSVVNTYRHVVTTMRSCLVGTFNVNGDFYGNRGEIMVTVAGSIWGHIAEQIVFEESGNGVVKVTIYRASFVPLMDNTGDRLPFWIKGETGC